jgi:hypothetical protein
MIQPKSNHNNTNPLCLKLAPIGTNHFTIRKTTFEADGIPAFHFSAYTLMQISFWDTELD